MKTLLNLFISGIPKGQPRPRAFARNMGGGRFAARVYDAGTAEGWKGTIVLACNPFKPLAPWDGALRLDLCFYMPRPKSLCRKCDPAGQLPHLAKPDRDNLDKAVMDTLTQAGFIRDDCLVYSGTVEKFYHAKGAGPGVSLMLTNWGEDK